MKDFPLDKILRSITAEKRLGELPDAEIAALLLNDLWAEEDVTSLRSALLQQAIERLIRAGGGSLVINEGDHYPSCPRSRVDVVPLGEKDIKPENTRIVPCVCGAKEV